MKRSAGPRAEEGKAEGRFAALTSGLLARKGFALPSNSPVADAAEETEAFGRPPRRSLKDEAVAPSPALTVINERSLEAGYPDNPSPEEIAALEAEAQEALSYFENFGGERAASSDAPGGEERAPARDAVRAGITVDLAPQAFMRLALGAAELDVAVQELIADAIEEYLDARGVASLGDCACLKALKPRVDEPPTG